MARRRWHELRGYPELEVAPMHLDSMLLFSAHHAGLEETVLPYPIYHVEHDRHDDPEVPQIEYGELIDWARRLHRRGAPIALNRRDWGLGKHVLPESRPPVA
jgi:hypothetical protein